MLVEQESGRTALRPHWQRLLDAIRAGVVETVYADRSDRLARDLYESRSFYALCARTGTGWKFWSEPWLDSGSPGGEEIRERAAFDAEMESRRIGSRLRRHYSHARSVGAPVARRAPLGLRIEGRGEARHYVPDDRPLAADLTMADAARLLIAKYLEAGTIWSGLRQWKDHLRSVEPVHDPELMARCLRFSLEATGDWLESAAAELQGHVAKQKNERIEAEDGSGKPTYRRLPWTAWELSMDRHEPLIDAATARRVLSQLAANANRGAATARGKARAKGDDHMPSFSEVAFCGACGRRLRTQSTRAGRKPGEPVYRTLRCSGAGKAVGLCDQRGISERKLAYELVPLLVKEAERVAGLMLPAPEGRGGAVDPALLEQLESTRKLAAQTNLPELQQAVLALEDRVAAQEAKAAADLDVEAGRKAAAQQLAHILPSIGSDLYTVPAVRRQVLQAIERIEVQDGKVSRVTLKG